MADYTKRDERRAESVRAVEEDRHGQSEPPTYVCSVCGVERSPRVQIFGVFKQAVPPLLYCAGCLPPDAI